MQPHGRPILGEFVVSSILAEEPAILWRHAVSPSGVNREFRPLLRMTFPSDISDLTAAWQPGERLFRSWLLLAGVVPIDYDDLVLEEVDPGRRADRLRRSSARRSRPRAAVSRAIHSTIPAGVGARATHRARPRRLASHRSRALRAAAALALRGLSPRLQGGVPMAPPQPPQSIRRSGCLTSRCHQQLR